MYALILLTSIVGLASPDAAPYGDPVAVIVQVTEGVTIDGRDGTVPAEAGAALLPGDRMVFADGGRAVVLHRTGRTEVVTRTTEPFEGADASEAAGVFARTVRTLRDIGTSEAREQPNRQGMIRPIAGAAVAIAPRNGVGVAPDHRTFNWFAVPDAEEYTVQLQRSGAEPERFAVSGDTVLVLPDDHPGLEPGEYTWMVGSSPRGRVAPPQHFRVAPADEVRAVDDAVSTAARQAGSPDAVRFLRVLLLHDAGLQYEALAELERLEAANPDRGDGRRIDTLRGIILDALGDLDGAAEAFRRAEVE